MSPRVSARAVAAPVLVVIAADDKMVPRACSEALIQAFAPGQVQVKVVPSRWTQHALDCSPKSLGWVSAFPVEPRDGRPLF